MSGCSGSRGSGVGSIGSVRGICNSGIQLTCSRVGRCSGSVGSSRSLLRGRDLCTLSSDQVSGRSSGLLSRSNRYLCLFHSSRSVLIQYVTGLYHVTRHLSSSVSLLCCIVSHRGRVFQCRDPRIYQRGLIVGQLSRCSGSSGRIRSTLSRCSGSRGSGVGRCSGRVGVGGSCLSSSSRQPCCISSGVGRCSGSVGVIGCSYRAGSCSLSVRYGLCHLRGSGVGSG